MGRFKLEYFISRRMLSGGKAEGAEGENAGSRSIMSRIAAITVGIGMCVMIVALAVIFGFRREITSKLEVFGGDVTIVNLDGNNSTQTQPISLNKNIEQAVERLPECLNISAYAIKGGIIRTDEAVQGVVLKGVDSSYDSTFFRKVLVSGSLPRIGDVQRYKDIIISQTLADALNLKSDDKVEMLFVGDDEAPRRDRFKISGIYNTQLQEVDKMMILTDLRNVQRLNGWDSTQVTGYQISCGDISKVSQFADKVYDAVFENGDDQSLMVTDIRENYPTLFDWLQAHNVNAMVIIVIMLTVALFNMISALLILLLERTSMIGVLKSLGMTNRSLQRVFVMRASFIVLKGMFWGNMCGIALCLIQKYTGAITLDPTGYFMATVPIQINISWLLLLNVGTFLIIISLLAIPTLIISYIRPETTLRYQ